MNTLERLFSGELENIEGKQASGSTRYSPFRFCIMFVHVFMHLAPRKTLRGNVITCRTFTHISAPTHVIQNGFRKFQNLFATGYIHIALSNLAF